MSPQHWLSSSRAAQGYALSSCPPPLPPPCLQARTPLVAMVDADLLISESLYAFMTNELK